MRNLIVISSIALLLSSGAIAQVIPTEQQKIDALKAAYRLNGNSMVGDGFMIDMTDPQTIAQAEAMAVRLTDPPAPKKPKKR